MLRRSVPTTPRDRPDYRCLRIRHCHFERLHGHPVGRIFRNRSRRCVVSDRHRGLVSLIDGEDGSDRADVTGVDDVIVNLALTAAQTTKHGTDVILHIVHVASGSGDDLLTGNHLDNSLSPGDANDTLIAGLGNAMLDGGAGNDMLIGGAGNDRIAGGNGDDTVVLVGNWGVDSVADFTIAGAGETIDPTGAVAIVDFADPVANLLTQSAAYVVIISGADVLTLTGKNGGGQPDGN